ncbi:MAG: hypothetical protein HZC28_18765 [Spirochaetes bacterium]|nr:hypothetical protein [Spirochaetota bacterium]
MIMLAVSIGIILFGGFIALAVPEKAKPYLSAICTTIAAIPALIAALPVLFTRDALSASILLPHPFGNAVFVLDPLSAFFILIISVMGALSSIYAVGYTKPYRDASHKSGGHFFFLPLLIASMMLVTVSSHVLVFLTAWEVMTIASFFAIMFEDNKESVLKAAVRYLIAMHVGVLLLTAAFLLSWRFSGSPDMASFAALRGNGITNALLILFFIGFAFKAGFMPFHTWLPEAHPAAPSHVSALMSGVMIKLGIYGMLRTQMLFGLPPVWFITAFLIASLVTALFGILYAIAQGDVKRFLAYSSVENIGIIGIGMAFGMLGMAHQNMVMAVAGFTGAILHILNHSVFKELLFFAAGAVYTKTHTRNIDELGGLIKTMPLTAVCFLAGALAISGIPFFNGFISEFFIYLSMLSGITDTTGVTPLAYITSFALFAFIGALVLAGFTRTFGIMFLGEKRNKHIHSTEVSPSMLIPMFIAGSFALILGVAPGILRLSTAPVEALVGNCIAPVNGLMHHTLTTFMQVFAIIAIIFALLAGIRFLLMRGKTVTRAPTWGCGYGAPNARMQYTSASYVSPLVMIVRKLIAFTAHRRNPHGLFPAHASFRAHTKDIIDRWTVRPATFAVRRFLRRFTWIQSGSTRQYVLFGVLFLIVLIFLAVGIQW